MTLSATNMDNHIQFADLTRKRQKWVEANRENGFEEGITNLLTDLYPDNAHFIYELLQNAEDTKADAVCFTLSEEGVRFEHNGNRLFNLRDVESITSIGVSTKRNDPTTIGKFGVGFKAVFAYTNTPEIHSGDFHFKIDNLVVPESLPNMSHHGKTVFDFPFNNPKKEAPKAVEEIQKGLSALADNTLLFLHHIRKIEYLLPNGDLGELRRVDVDEQGIGKRIEIHACRTGVTNTLSSWLRYSKEVSIMDESGEVKTCQVAIAFRIVPQTTDSIPGEEDEKKNQKKSTKQKAQWNVVPCEPGQVSIFFPAEKETSKLRYHLHAPFASTVARDSVRDCKANDELRDALAELTTEALADIRSRELLTMSFLAVLPNKDDALTGFYEPIREAIVKSFQEDDLVPTRSGSHAKAISLYRGPSDISSVIDDEDLSLFTGYKTPLWSANAPQRGQREDKFLESLGIEQWAWKELKNIFSETLVDDGAKDKVEQWLSGKSDTWLMRFYGLMESCHDQTESYYDPSPLATSWNSLKGIRAIDGKGNQEHVTPDGAYFPQKASNSEKTKASNIPTKLRIVKPEVYDKGRLGENAKKDARDFLQRIGVKEYDEVAEIERRLKWYSELGKKVIDKSHYQDVKLFIEFLKKNPSKVSVFEKIRFLVAQDNSTGELYWTEPTSIALDAPFEETGLGELLRIHGRRQLWAGYSEIIGKTFTNEDFVGFLKQVGAFCQLEVTMDSCLRNNMITFLNARSTHTKLNIDWNIANIESYLAANSQIASRLIWMALLRAGADVAHAKYRPNQQYSTQIAPSQLVQRLKSCAWIPDKNGTFRKPKDMTREMLMKEFPYDDRNGILSAIGFEEKAREASEEFKTRDEDAKKLGFASARELEEAQDLLKAKREGRIREVPAGEGDATVASTQSRRSDSDGLPFESGNGEVNRPYQVNAPQTESPLPAKSQAQDVSVPPVLRRISKRICMPGRSPIPLESKLVSHELDEDEDEATPAPVDYSRRIARAEERNATEILRLEREQELLNKANGLPRYTYGWFLALLELECLASSEKNADGKTISIRFGKIEKDGESSKTIILKEPNRFIPQSVEEFSGVRVDLLFNDGRTAKLHIESFTAKEFSLLGKLKSIEELNGLDLDKVVDAAINVQNPSFLLQELLNRFKELGLVEEFDMKANLTPEIEFVFGPPGTGKTTYLAGKVLIPMMRGKEKARVLVLTPTNKAADVLTNRIIDEMGSDMSYRDWLVRFGTSANDMIEKEGVARGRSFDISVLDRSVTVTTIARFAYDGFSINYGKLHEIEWDAIVIDEASMIPLVNIIYPLYGRKPRKFIVAGDPFQIEPIVSVDQWKDENIYTLVGLDKPGSFARPCTEPHNYPVTNLDTQYRSIPAIAEVFSHFTYNGILKHHRSSDGQRPLRIDDIDIKPVNLIKFPVSKYESIYRAKRLNSGTSYQTYSALFTFEFVQGLAKQIQKNHAGEPLFRVGIIAPYRAQANLLTKLIDSQSTKIAGVEIQVGTIHGFQGDECDIIIAVFNPPPSISSSPQMFLNKQNILNVAISRARDYLFLVMPDTQTEDVENLRKIAKIESLIKNGGFFSEYDSHAIEEVILGNRLYLEENTFATGHQMVNVYLKPERFYEVRSDDTAIDVQIHKGS